jgi:serine acetyltransferase
VLVRGVVVGRNAKGFPVIGDNVYIASNSTVIGNIHIGNNVIIGAGSVVTKDIPDNSIVAGNPARIIKTLDESYFNEIM